MNAPNHSQFERLRNDAYFTIDPRPVEALFLGCPELRVIVNAVSEPFCGGGHLAEDLKAEHLKVYASDIVDYGYRDQFATLDFFEIKELPDGVNAIISNSAYDKSTLDAVVKRALDLLPYGGVVALLFNHRFDAAGERWNLFSPTFGFYAKIILPFRIWWFHPEPGKKKTSPGQNFAWYLWRKGYSEPSKTVYLPPEYFKPFSTDDLRPIDLYLKDT